MNTLPRTIKFPFTTESLPNTHYPLFIRPLLLGA
jgi:hypothetical protein